jgi:hypothetical protein
MTGEVGNPKAQRFAVQIEGVSQREAARRFGIDPRTVAKMLAFSVPPGYRRSRPPARPKLASSEFARHCAGEFAALGEFTLAGFGAPQQIFGRASGVSNQDSLGATGIISPG